MLIKFKLVLLVMFATLSRSLYADNEAAQINLEYKKHQGNHNNLPVPADIPDVYYDSYNQQIIIDGLGVVDYYDVEIASATSFITVITTQVNGSYDTIDISSLPQGEYVITIESPWGNTYEGFFEIL